MNASRLLFSPSGIEKNEILRRNRQPITIASTYNASDPIAWRQTHHWALATGFVRMRLRKGVQVSAPRGLTKGRTNVACLDFKPEAQ